MNTDLLHYAFKNLLHRKMRSFLSLLSIMIGITAIFALVSFGIGINDYVDMLAQEQGTDKVLITPKGSNNLPGLSSVLLTDQDIDFIRDIRGVSEATGSRAGTVKVEYNDYRAQYPFLLSIDTESEQQDLLLETFTLDLLDGKYLEEDTSRHVMLGYSYTLTGTLFDEPIRLGDDIFLNDQEFEVIGFFDEVGNPADDANVYITDDLAKELLDTQGYEYIILRASRDQNITLLSERVERQLGRFRDVEEGNEDFSIQTFEEAIQAFTTIFGVVVAVVVLIALVSVVVAAVNIMNTMYTAVLERTQEIGVLKSLGSTNQSIQMIFITEAGLLGGLGGIAGVLLGYLIAQGGSAIAASQGLSLLQPSFPLWLTISCFGFAFLVGLFSGYLPSKQAASLKPVDALRYE